MTSFWNATVEMWDFHRDIIDGRGHECSHYCFGGVPQVGVPFCGHTGWMYVAATEHWCWLGTQNGFVLLGLDGFGQMCMDGLVQP